MKILTLIVALSVFSAAATAQEQKRHYVVTDLGRLPGGTSARPLRDNQGVVTGFSIDADGIEHAVLWYNGAITNVAKQNLRTEQCGLWSQRPWPSSRPRGNIHATRTMRIFALMQPAGNAAHSFGNSASRGNFRFSEGTTEPSP